MRLQRACGKVGDGIENARIRWPKEDSIIVAVGVDDSR